MGDTFSTSGLREKRAAIAGQIVDLRRQADKLQADLVHIDAVLRIYGLEPEAIPTKGRMPVRSTYFGRNELGRRWRDHLREKGSIRADDVAVQAMKDKGMDPEKDRRPEPISTDAFLYRSTTCGRRVISRRSGHGRGVRWIAKEVPQDALI